MLSWSEDNMLSLRVKISCFRVKAHLYFIGAYIIKKGIQRYTSVYLIIPRGRVGDDR